MKLPPILFTPNVEIDTAEPQDNECTRDEDSIDDDDTPLDNMPDDVGRMAKAIRSIIKGMKNIESMKLDSDALLDILRRRLDSHFETHKMESLHEHSCLE